MGLTALRRTTAGAAVLATAVAGAPLAEDGTISFRVVRRARSTTYVVRLLATRRHAAATAEATVAATG
jgi:hypothetical protein